MNDATYLALVVLLVGTVLLLAFRRLSRRGDVSSWTRGDVDAYLDDSEVYDREQLEEIGAYDYLLSVADDGKITSEDAFERLCDAIVMGGKDGWEDELEAIDPGDLDGAAQSLLAHREATGRAPPVDLGEEVDLGVIEIERHHSGALQAMGKVEGFVVFVEDVPESVAEGDVIRAKIMYFNRGKTSASASFEGTVD